MKGSYVNFMIRRILLNLGIHMKKQIALLVTSVLLVACATTENYEKMLNSWVGAAELDLVRKWGPPVQSYEAGGRKFLLYQSARNVFIPGTAPTYTTRFIGNTAYTSQTAGSPAQNIGLSCKTTFELGEGHVLSWRYEGNDCKALAPE